MQVVLGLTPLRAGLGVLPLEGCLLFVGPIAGKISDKWKSPLFPTIGLVFFAISCFYEAILFTVATTYLIVAFALVLVALGQGIFTSPNLRIIMSSVPAGNRGVTNSFRQTLYNIGDTTGPVLSITLITLGIPYHVFTSLLQSTIAARHADCKAGVCERIQADCACIGHSQPHRDSSLIIEGTEERECDA